MTTIEIAALLALLFALLLLGPSVALWRNARRGGADPSAAYRARLTTWRDRWGRQGQRDVPGIEPTWYPPTPPTPPAPRCAVERDGRVPFHRCRKQAARLAAKRGAS